MIGKLSGTLDSIDGSQVILDVNGVGYVVTCSARTLRQLGPAKSPASLLIETQVREDAINLFGFADAEEKGWFLLLTQADGVGPKLALRLVTELKDKVPAFGGFAVTANAKPGGAETALPPSLASDAVSALINLGYRRAEAFAAVAAASRANPKARIDELIRQSLAELSRKDSAA